MTVPELEPKQLSEGRLLVISITATPEVTPEGVLNKIVRGRVTPPPAEIK